MVTGTTIAQAIPVAVSPILTRLYSPEDFGIYAIYFSTLMIASVVATGKYEMAIVLPEKDEDAEDILVLSIVIALVVGVVMLAAILAFSVIFDSIFGMDLSVAVFVPLGVFLIGLSQSFHYYFNRKGQYRTLVKGRIFRSVSYSAVSLAIGAVRPAGIGIVIADSLGYVASNAFMWRKKGTRFKHVDWQSLKRVSLQYINFPKYLIVSGFLEKGSGQAPVLFLTNLFNATISAGYFSFAQRMIVTPADLISRAIGDVFRQRASGDFALYGNCIAVFNSTFRKLAGMAVVAFGLGFFVIVEAFAFVFGAEWRVAGEYAQIMMPMFFLQFIASPLSSMFVIANKQKYDLVLQSLLLTGASLAFVAGFFIFDSIRMAIIIFTIVYCIKYVAELYLSYRFSRGK